MGSVGYRNSTETGRGNKLWYGKRSPEQTHPYGTRDKFMATDWLVNDDVNHEIGTELLVPVRASN